MRHVTRSRPSRLPCATLLLSALSLWGCREIPKQGTLRFVDSGDAGAAADTQSSPRFQLPPTRPARFTADYQIRTPAGVERHEQLSLDSDGAAGVRRLQTLRFEAPGEPAVHRQTEERLQDGVHLSRGPGGDFWRHPDRETWRQLLDRDLGAWRGLADELGLRLASPPGPPAQGPQIARQRTLRGPGPEVRGTLSLDSEGRLVGVDITAEGPAGSVRYQARLSPLDGAGPDLQGDPLGPVPAERIHAPERPRTVRRLQSWLKRVRGGS